MISKKNTVAISLGMSFIVLAWFIFSRLSFAPVPWPDGSAFFLPARELLSWPPHWKMHSQSAFIPSYDQVNFNMMPLLPAILGTLTPLLMKLGMSASHAIKAISLCAFVLWAWLLGYWTSKNSRWKGLAFLLGGAALLDPTLRWGTLVVRSETWVGLLGLCILMEARKSEQGDSRCSLWKMAFALAAAAYIHFEAILLVPITAVALFRQKEGVRAWIFSLFEVGWKTALLLVPWGIYVLAHFAIFQEQMNIQFHRLSHSSYWISTPYLFFHSLFLELGSPVGVPKIFNLAKIIFWVGVFCLTFGTLDAVLKKKGHFEFLLAGAVGFYGSLYLWCTKPEVWFITLCHMTFWAWLGIFLIEISQGEYRHLKFIQNGFRLLLSVWIFIALSSTVVQNYKISTEYQWSTYQNWIDCIEKKVQLTSHQKPIRVWQPYVPDILVELSVRHPEWDLMRALDFEMMKERAIDFSQTTSAIVMTRFFSESEESYEGPERPSDRKLVWSEVDQPFGQWIIEGLPHKQPGQWQRHICRRGPFFASIAVR